MAKGNPFLGTVRGSFGDITLKGYRGKQVITRKAANPKNPRTSKQTYQRMFFATVSKARTAMSDIINHSFEQIPHGIDSLAYFTKRNIALIRDAAQFDYSKQAWVNPGMNFAIPKATSFQANPYRISEGSLSVMQPSPAPSQNVEAWGREDASFYKKVLPLFGTLTGSQITMTELYYGLMSKYDISVGDYVTALIVTGKQDAVAPYPLMFKFVRFKMCKVMIDDSEGGNLVEYYSMFPSNINGKNFEFPDILYEHEGVQPVQNMLKTDTKEYGKWTTFLDLGDPDLINLTVSTGKDDLDIVEPALVKPDEQIVAFAWIHSRPGTDGEILTSTQDLILADPTGQRIPFNLDLETAFDLWTKHGKAIGDSKYILEGGDI